MTPRLFFSLAAFALVPPPLGAFQPAGADARIVTAGGTVTETVFALGRGGDIVGVDQSSTHPEAEVRNLPQVGYHRALSAEGVLSLRPTVLLATAQAGPPEAMERIRAAGVRVELVESGHDVASAERLVRAVAGALGEPAKAEALAASLKADYERARALAGGAAAEPRVLFVMAHGGGALQVAGANTAAQAMISLAGAVNAVQGWSGYKPLTSEAAAMAAPDVILTTSRSLGGAGGIDALLAHPGLALTPAARRQRVVVMDDLFLLGFGPRTGEALLALCKALHQREQATARTEAHAARSGGMPAAAASHP